MKVFLYLLVVLFVQMISSEKVNNFKINSYFSFITLHISKTGYHKIFNEVGATPDEICINNIIQDNRDNFYNFTKENNIINLIWNKNINNCK